MARLALQLEARELTHHADSARNGFVAGWHRRYVGIRTVADSRGACLADMRCLRQAGADNLQRLTVVIGMAVVVARTRPRSVVQYGVAVVVVETHANKYTGRSL